MSTNQPKSTAQELALAALDQAWAYYTPERDETPDTAEYYVYVKAA